MPNIFHRKIKRLQIYCLPGTGANGNERQVGGNPCRRGCRPRPSVRVNTVAATIMARKVLTNYSNNGKARTEIMEMTVFWRRVGVCTLCAAFLPNLLPASATAASLHPLADIAQTAATAAKRAAEAAGYARVAVQVRPLDQRLRLRQCDQPLTTMIAQSSRALGAVSVGIRCNSANPWTLYVRTEVSAELSLPVLTRTLPRGALIAENDVEMVTRAVSREPGALILDPDAVIGLETRRPLAAGSTLQHSQLAAPIVVERGPKRNPRGRRRRPRGAHAGHGHGQCRGGSTAAGD